MMIAVATIPVVIVGFLGKDFIEGSLRDPRVIAATTIIFGLVFWLADRNASGNIRTYGQLTFAIAVFIGLMQAIALVPGVSRSGITMTAALFAGMTRTDSARVSLLLSIPTIAAAGLLATIDLVREGNPTDISAAVLAAGLSFAVALAAIAVLMKWLKSASFAPFVLYRIVLGVAIIVWMIVANAK